MTLHHSSVRTSALALGLLLLASCGGSNGVNTATSRPVAAGWAGREDVTAAIALLNKGEVPAARKKLARVLKQQPNDMIALSLAKQIDTPAETLLGAASFPYQVRAGDTLSSLAARFLGDPTQFFALGRYNGLATPGALTPGRMLRIPGHERRDPPQIAKPDTPRTAPAARPPERSATPAVVAPPPARVAPAVNPARAAQLRAAGLEQLNRGAIDRAVVLLAQASRADPRNGLIRRDLDRASRIQRTVWAQR